jgi:versiconal hemiacetal acetate esterase
MIENLEVPNGPKVRVYKPTGHEGTALPMIVFVHGGGWFAGNLDTEDRTCRIICHGVPAWVVSVEYRCNFDVPLKDMVDDLYDAFNWARGRAESHGADPNKMIVWGGSAGGALAIALTYRLIQEGRGAEIAGLVAMNPLAVHPDATPSQYKHLMTSYVDNGGPIPFVSGKDTLRLYEYRDIEPPKTDIALFPAAGGAEGVKGFPPTYIITSDNDASRDDGTVLEACLKDAGVKVKRNNVKGVAHYFWVFDLPTLNASFWESLTAGFHWVLEEGRRVCK